MRRPLFHLVRQIVDGEKYFDVSKEEIARELTQRGQTEVTAEHDVCDDSGEIITTELRLNIAARGAMPESWQLALKLHNVRIDGIDYEQRFDTPDGNRNKGWHRHRWNPSVDSAEHEKIPIAQLDGVMTREQFLIRAFSVLRIRVNRADHGTGELPFNS